MSGVFDAYAQYYDLLYRDKDYSTESEFVTECIRRAAPDASRILELGCGTGAHAAQLAQMGYEIHGVDMSAEMLYRAEARKAQLSAEVAERLSFSQGDVRSVRTGQLFDVVISLFHVISYQATNEDLENTFETAAIHLPEGGIFLFDFWYGPAVMSQRPELRIKRMENDKIRVTRIAEPLVHENEKCVDVHYDIFIERRDSGEISHISEKHKMRYIFLAELERLLDSGGWSNHQVFEWLTSDVPDDNSWSAFAIATR
jgi:SAM-dependent methyltransferase